MPRRRAEPEEPPEPRRIALRPRTLHLRLGEDPDAPDLTIEPGRFSRALNLEATRGNVTLHHEDEYKVASQRGGGSYIVEFKRGIWECDCPDWGEVRPCVHVLAVLLRKRILPKPTQEPEPEDAPKPDPTRFDWAAYRKAEHMIPRVLPRLAWRLFDTLPQPLDVGPGRPRIPQNDALLCALLWSIGGKNARHEQATRDRLAQEGLLSRPVEGTAISRTLVDEETTPLLEEALRRTRDPFAAVDPESSPLTLAVVGDSFAVDSTGFTPSRRGHYNKEKHGLNKAIPWLKCHLMISTKAHLITGARITRSSGEKTHDTTQFKELLEETTDAFPIVGYVLGDGAYANRDNVKLVRATGGQPLFPPRSDTITRQFSTPGWGDMVAFFTMHRTAFDSIYHQRSVIEGVNSAIKRRFGEQLRSRTPTSRTNELLCKLIAYNLVVLVQWLHFLHVEDEWLDRVL